MVTFDSVRHAVEQYLAMGFRPLPLYGITRGRCACGSPECKPRDHGKHEPPETDGLWKEGAEYSPEHFGQNDNVALAMGPYTDADWLVCLDVDGPLDLTPHFADPLPPTLTQKSPRGMHYVFTVPAYTPLGNWVDVLGTKYGTAERGATGIFQPALDLRYARGRVVVSPSRGAGGVPYQWLDFREPAPLPPSVTEAILGRRRDRGLPVAETWHRNGKRP